MTPVVFGVRREPGVRISYDDEAGGIIETYVEHGKDLLARRYTRFITNGAVGDWEPERAIDARYIALLRREANAGSASSASKRALLLGIRERWFPTEFQVTVRIPEFLVSRIIAPLIDLYDRMHFRLQSALRRKWEAEHGGCADEVTP